MLTSPRHFQALSSHQLSAFESAVRMTVSDEISHAGNRSKPCPNSFPLKGTSVPCHPADQTGALANWSDVYGVMVGPRKQPFALHRHIVNKIPLLRDRFLESADSVESITGSMTIGLVDTMAFAVAVDFAYTGHFDEKSIRTKYAKPDDDDDADVSETDEEQDGVVLNAFLTQQQQDGKNDDKEDKDSSTEEDEDSILPTYDNLLVSVFDLAQALQYEALANATVDAYVRVLAEDPPSAWALSYLQRKGLETSKMMLLMLRAIAWCIHSEGYEAWEGHSFMEGWVNECVGNGKLVMRAMAEHAGREEGCPFVDRGMDVCVEYHCHVSTERCVVRKKKQVIAKMVTKGRVKKMKKV